MFSLTSVELWFHPNVLLSLVKIDYSPKNSLLALVILCLLLKDCFSITEI